MARYAVRYLRDHGRPSTWAGWLLFDILLWPLTLVTNPTTAIAKLRGTFAGLTDRTITSKDIDAWQ